MRAKYLSIRFLAALSVLAGSAPATAAAAELTLEQALGLAAQNSPALAQSRARLEEAQADAIGARSALLPKLSASASYSWLDPNRLSPLGAPSGGAVPTLYSAEGFAGLKARQVLFDGLRSWSSLSAAQRGIDAERSAVQASALDSTLVVTQAFVRLLESQQLVQVAAQALERQRAFESLIEGQLELGKGARLDLLKAQAQRLEAERARVASEETRKAAAAALRRWIGLESLEDVIAAGELSAPAGELAPTNLREAARASNPDLRRLAAQERQAEAQADLARGGYLPEVSLQGTYGYRFRDVGGSADEWTAGFGFEWVLFDGLASHAQVAKAKARVAQLREAHRALELQIESDLQDALAAATTAAAAAVSTAKGVEVSQEAAQAALELYSLGRATSLDVLTSQADLVRAQASQVVALGDEVIARARLARLTGR
ncbi:MAG TPA: TolC family protein [Myxococcales bacterium]